MEYAEFRIRSLSFISVFLWWSNSIIVSTTTEQFPASFASKHCSLIQPKSNFHINMIPSMLVYVLNVMCVVICFFKFLISLFTHYTLKFKFKVIFLNSRIVFPKCFIEFYSVFTNYFTYDTVIKMLIHVQLQQEVSWLIRRTFLSFGLGPLSSDVLAMHDIAKPKLPINSKEFW